MRRPAVGEVVQPGQGQRPAEPAALGVRVDADDVDLAERLGHRRRASWTFVQWKPSSCLRRRVPRQQHALGVEPGLRLDPGDVRGGSSPHCSGCQANARLLTATTASSSSPTRSGPIATPSGTLQRRQRQRFVPGPGGACATARGPAAARRARRGGRRPGGRRAPRRGPRRSSCDAARRRGRADARAPAVRVHGELDDDVVGCSASTRATAASPPSVHRRSSSGAPPAGGSRPERRAPRGRGGAGSANAATPSARCDVRREARACGGRSSVGPSHPRERDHGGDGRESGARSAAAGPRRRAHHARVGQRAGAMPPCRRPGGAARGVVVDVVVPPTADGAARPCRGHRAPGGRTCSRRCARCRSAARAPSPSLARRRRTWTSTVRVPPKKS